MRVASRDGETCSFQEDCHMGYDEPKRCRNQAPLTVHPRSRVFYPGERIDGPPCNGDLAYSVELVNWPGRLLLPRDLPMKVWEKEPREDKIFGGRLRRALRTPSPPWRECIGAQVDEPQCDAGHGAR